MNTPLMVDPKKNTDMLITYAVNKSGGALGDGDVVILDTTNTLGAGKYVSATTSTTADDPKLLGVVYAPGQGDAAFPDGNVIPVMVFGVHENVRTTGVSAGNILAQSTTAKTADPAAATAVVGAVLGIALTATASGRSKVFVNVK